MTSSNESHVWKDTEKPLRRDKDELVVDPRRMLAQPSTQNVDSLLMSSMTSTEEYFTLKLNIIPPITQQNEEDERNENYKSLADFKYCYLLTIVTVFIVIVVILMLYYLISC